MSIMHQIIVDRIDARLQALGGLSDRKASLRACGKPDLIRDIRRGKVPGWERLGEIARALETTADYLRGETENPAPAPADRSAQPVPSRHELPRDLPVYGTAMGAEASFYSDHAGEIAIEQTDLNSGEVIDYLRRPPALSNRPEAYALYTAGDSMAPKYERGEAVIVDPSRQPVVNDYVVVYLRRTDADSAAAVLLKRLARRSSSYVELEQFNPAATFRLDRKAIMAIHRVTPWDEAFGF